MMRDTTRWTALALAAFATVGVVALPKPASAQTYHHYRHHRAYNDHRAYNGGDRYYRSNADRGQYDDRHCGSGNGAVGTIAGGAGGAVLGNVLGGGTLGTVAGGVGGALLGRTLDKNNTRDRNRNRNGC